MPTGRFDLNAVHSVSRETVDKFNLFVDLFDKWSRKINLIAPSTRDMLWDRHIGDSLQLLALDPGPKRWLDLGSGGGFPGLVMAICMAESGGFVDMVESNQKKAAFLRMALQETGAAGRVHAMRIEDAPRLGLRPDRVSARALASLDSLLELAAPWLSEQPDIKAFFHKGRDYRHELDKARGRWAFELVEHTSQIHPDSIVLEIARLRSV